MSYKIRPFISVKLDNPSGVIISMQRCNKSLPIAILLDTRTGIQNFTCARNRQGIRIPIRRVRVKFSPCRVEKPRQLYIDIYIHTTSHNKHMPIKHIKIARNVCWATTRLLRKFASLRTTMPLLRPRRILSTPHSRVSG